MTSLVLLHKSNMADGRYVNIIISPYSKSIDFDETLCSVHRHTFMNVYVTKKQNFLNWKWQTVAILKVDFANVFAA